MTDSGNAVAHDDTRVQRLFPVQTDGASRHRLPPPDRVALEAPAPLDGAEVLRRERACRLHADVTDEDERGVVGNEVLFVHSDHALSVEAREIQGVAAVGRIDRMGESGHAVDGVIQPRLGTAQPVQDLLEHGEPLGFPPAQNGVRHALRFLAKEELDRFAGKIDRNLEIFLLGAGGDWILVTRPGTVSAIRVVLRPEHPVAGLAIFELVELLARRFHRRRARPVELIVEDVTDAQLVARATALLEKLLLHFVNLVQNRELRLEVGRSDPWSFPDGSRARESGRRRAHRQAPASIRTDTTSSRQCAARGRPRRRGRGSRCREGLRECRVGWPRTPSRVRAPRQRKR